MDDDEEESQVTEKTFVVGRNQEYYESEPEYTKHTIDMTPGQENPIKKVKGFLDREREKPSEKDVKEWASTESTMNKYRERYKDEWKAKLSEVVAKMIEKL